MTLSAPNPVQPPDDPDAVRRALCGCPEHGPDAATWACTQAAALVEGWLAWQRNRARNDLLAAALDAARARDAHAHRIARRRADGLSSPPRADDLDRWEYEARVRWSHSFPALQRLIDRVGHPALIPAQPAATVPAART